VRFVLGGAEVPVLTGFFAAVAIRHFDSRSPASGLDSLADRAPIDGLACLDISVASCQFPRTFHDALSLTSLRVGTQSRPAVVSIILRSLLALCYF
jgi:hypothetical protein